MLIKILIFPAIWLLTVIPGWCGSVFSLLLVTKKLASFLLASLRALSLLPSCQLLLYTTTTRDPGPRKSNFGLASVYDGSWAALSFPILSSFSACHQDKGGLCCPCDVYWVVCWKGKRGRKKRRTHDQKYCKSYKNIDFQ